MARFALLGASIGLLVGLIEAAILFLTPRVPTLDESEVGWVIWALAPLLDLGLFLLLGAILGCVAACFRNPGPKKIAILTAVLMGLSGSFVAWTAALVHVWAGDLDALKDMTVQVGGFLAAFVLALYLMRLTWGRLREVFNPVTPWPLRRMTIAVAATAVVLASYLAWSALGEPSPSSVHASESAAARKPNIVFIVLDTVRADHLSSYGYARPTTPNIDRLARQGVLFENAIAPSSWTLPSHASMFTGLLPHQHGANTYSPLDARPKTIAEILQASGYETANFFANGFGVRAWGLDQGFEVQDDLRYFLPHNIGSTLVGRAIVQPLWMTISRPDSYFRRRAPGINTHVLRWFHRRSDRPFFLFINYLDAHDPHVAPEPFDTRFGEISPDVVRRVSFGNGAPIDPPLSAEAHASMINGYDNCLSFLDDQLGKLLAELSASPEWKNTIVIVTSDHGEAFGEHGLYLHNRSLYFREALHVPLVVSGPGIPAGLRVESIAPIRQLFPTILDLAMPGQVPFQASSLRRFWTPGFKVDPLYDHAVSELVPFLPNFRPVMMSLMIDKWHYIRKSDTSAELYNWKSDPEERVDLAKSPEHQQTMKGLEQRLMDLVGESTQPWWEPEYLLALNGPASSFVDGALGRRNSPASPGNPHWPIGSSQAFFASDKPSFIQRPDKSDEDLIRSLPYR